MAKMRRGERRGDILQTLARMLEERQGERITTAELAAAVGVSEAALYRHFPSKARMFEGLLEFIEEALFTRINAILAEEPIAERRVSTILFLVLGFADKNPGMARILYGDILTGETDRLRKRVVQIYDRLETHLRQVLREAELPEGARLTVSDSAGLLVSILEGRIARYVRSGFRFSPVEGWEQQWQMLEPSIFRPDMPAL